MRQWQIRIVYWIVFLSAALTPVLAGDFSDDAISVFQKNRKLNNDFRAAVESGPPEEVRLKGKIITDYSENEYTQILRALAKHYCADPRDHVLGEFVATLVHSAGSAYEYPRYVFAELYACEPDHVTEAIRALKPADQKLAVGDLNWGFLNITHGKNDTFPNYKNLAGRLDKLKREIGYSEEIRSTQ